MVTRQTIEYIRTRINEAKLNFVRQITLSTAKIIVICRNLMGWSVHGGAP